MSNKTAKSVEGYEKTQVIKESQNYRRAEQVLKKEKTFDKRKKHMRDFTEDKLHFTKSKKEAYNETVKAGKLEQ